MGSGSFAMGEYANAFGQFSFAGGLGAAGAAYHVYSSGNSSFIFAGRKSHVISDCSAVLGGAYNTIASGNSYSAIVGGAGIALTADDYPNYTAVEN